MLINIKKSKVMITEDHENVKSLKAGIQSFFCLVLSCKSRNFIILFRSKNEIFTTNHILTTSKSTS